MKKFNGLLDSEKPTETSKATEALCRAAISYDLQLIMRIEEGDFEYQSSYEVLMAAKALMHFSMDLLDRSESGAARAFAVQLAALATGLLHSRDEVLDEMALFASKCLSLRNTKAAGLPKKDVEDMTEKLEKSFNEYAAEKFKH